MKHQVSLVLLGCLLAASLVQASPGQEKPKSTAQLLKARRSSYFNEPALAKFRSNDADIAVALDQKADQDKLTVGGVSAQGSSSSSSSSTGTKDASSGRLFLKKFLMFKNMFSSNSQPVIPIIITGAGTSTTATGTTTPTVTVTSTGTIPSATGTITTSPTTGTTTARQGDALAYGADTEDDDSADAEEPQGQAYPGAAMAANAEMIDEQALEAALAAGAQEYEVVTDAEVQGTGATESKATQNNLINLRRKGARRGQQISVRIPPRYRRYFKNGQKVMLNTNRRPNKRRVVRKRVQNKKLQNRRRVNGAGNKKNNRKNRNKNKGNKRTRITAV